MIHHSLHPLPPPSFTLNSITVILSTITYLSLRLPASNRFRTLSAVQLLKLLNHMSHNSYHTLSSPAQNNRMHRIQTPLTHLQSPHNHPTFISSHLISVQPAGSTRSSSLVTLARPATSSSLRITDRSFRYASPCLWNHLPSSLSQPQSTSSVYAFPVDAPSTFLTLLTHHSHHQ